jgi:glyceraldehyde 3-phosphate dehydrogenase
VAHRRGLCPCGSSGECLVQCPPGSLCDWSAQGILARDGGSSEEDQALLREHFEVVLGAAEAHAIRGAKLSKPVDLVLYGHGRIGRLLNRMFVEKTGAGNKLVLRAVVVRQQAKTVEEDLRKRAALLVRDSVHGEFQGAVSIDVANSSIIANGNTVRFIYADVSTLAIVLRAWPLRCLSQKPESVDYTAYGISDAILVDNTGAWRDRKGLERHLKAKGVKTVVLTAPAEGGDVPTIVAGVNDDRISGEDRVYSAASCTTNAIVPLLKLLDEACGIESGHMETVHSYTNDQHLVDAMHKKSRRGRAAPLNMVPTETGAAEAVKIAVPELAGKLTASAIRVPTPNVSLIILNVRPTATPVSAPALYKILKAASMRGAYHNQVDFSEDPDAVSTDFVGRRAATIIDWPASIVTDTSIILKAWYDNEAGYSAQVVRLVQKLAGVE